MRKQGWKRHERKGELRGEKEGCTVFHQSPSTQKEPEWGGKLPWQKELERRREAQEAETKRL